MKRVPAATAAGYKVTYAQLNIAKVASIDKTAFKQVSIHSFIHYGDLYNASSRLRSTSPDPCMAKKNSFQA